MHAQGAGQRTCRTRSSSRGCCTQELARLAPVILLLPLLRKWRRGSSCLGLLQGTACKAGAAVTTSLSDEPRVLMQVMRIFQSLPDLRCLYLTGNPVVSKIKNYRKTMIATIPTLNYLDDRPVFPVERRCAEAW